MDLTGQKVNETYGQLLQIIDDIVYDGFGNEIQLLPLGLISSSNQITFPEFPDTASYSNHSLSASWAPAPPPSITDWIDISNKPVGLLSSSFQISTSISGAFNSVSQSIAADIFEISSSLGPNDVYWDSVLGRPTIVSESSQINFQLVNNKPILLSSSYQIASDVSGAFNSLSSSLDLKLNYLSQSFLQHSHSFVDSFGISFRGSFSGSLQNIIQTGFKTHYRTQGSGQLISYRIDSFDYETGDSISGSIIIGVQRNNVTIGSASLSNTGSVYINNLSGWSTSINRDDKISYFVVSNDYIKNLNLTLQYNSSIL